MPYYTYRCPDCEHDEQQFQKISTRDVPIEAGCPKCRSGKYYRIVEAPGFTTSESLGRIKAPQDFRNLLSEMKKEAGPTSTIKER